MQKYHNSVSNSLGHPVSGATVTVLTYPGGLTATIYSDNGVTPMSNPMKSDANGNFAFYGAGGRYSIRISGASLDTTTIDDIELYDPKDSVATTLPDGASITWDMSAGKMALLVLNSTQTKRTLTRPTNNVPGEVYRMLVKQGTAGGEDINGYDASIVALTDLSITSTPNATTALEFFSPDGLTIYAAKVGGGTAAAANSPAGPTSIAVADWPNIILQSSDYWSNEDIWDAVGLTRGAYTGVNGTTYQQQIGFGSPRLAPGSGAVSWRATWAYPTGTTEVKAYPSIIAGNKPGWYQGTSANPAGYDISLPNGTIDTTVPAGKTPNTLFPIALPVPSLKSRVAYNHNQPPTGRGQLTYDIWLQNTGTQGHGFAAPPITTEIMIPLNYWGGYGAYVAGGGGRNPAWYVKDDTIDGLLWHIYYAPNFNGAWVFIVFEPDAAVPNRQLDLAAFINYAINQGWTAAGISPTGSAATHVVSVELGIEPLDGTGDITISTFDVTL